MNDVDKKYGMPPKHVAIQIVPFDIFLFVGCSCGAILRAYPRTIEQQWSEHCE